MNWLNINISTLRSPEFIGSEPEQRATWLCVLGYSVDQENSGRLIGAASWKDRQWQQTCGVTLQEVVNAARLLVVDGDDIVVKFYPVDKQHEVVNKREAGRNGGRAKAAKAPSSATSTTPSSATSSAISCASPDGGSCASTEGKGREGKEKKDNGREEEGESEATTARPQSLDEALAFGTTQPGWRAEVITKWFHSREGQGWVRGNGIPITNWRSDLTIWVMDEARKLPTTTAPKTPSKFSWDR